MIEADNLEKLIIIIPSILNHIAPGYIFYSIILYQIGNKANDYKHVLFNSIIISYGINSILGIFVSQENKWFPLVAVSMAVFISIIIIKTIEEGWLRDIAFKFNLYKTAKKDLLSDIVDSKLGMWLYVYLDDEQIIYLGKLTNYEDVTEDNHRYILLSEYSCYSYDGTELKINDDDNTKCVLINILNITRIEMIYDVESKKIKKSKEGSATN
ncbi:hypothetical protein [Tissierella sp. Yu-01]|uniref:hypothetical protein n=1 Tax=Tissierella sp. Yu-01 TaxID=3035694 RepID=UPI00240DA687|nr:hypothetical protein [Tissierella sp. Yu-01]WFA10348.1 hypothetical protein P3962_07290 [Tissierella sp. Yu-01]